MLDPALAPTRLVAPGERKLPVVESVETPGITTFRLIAGLVVWVIAVLWLRATRRLTPGAGAERLVPMLEGFGGLWIKAGQLLALRVDLFSPELCRELSALQTRGAAAAFSLVRPTLEAELGPVDEIFETFEETPFAITWIGQLHRARLRREDAWVAVKIQRPGIASTFARDLRVMRMVVAVLTALRLYPSVRWPRAIQELEQIAREESDFRFEAAAVERMRQNLPRRKIAVPDVFGDYSTRRVLVTEFIHAALMTDFIKLRTADPHRLTAWLDENRIDPRRLGRRLIHSFLKQLFEDNFYHGDLYPGNIVLLREGRVALLHFGACSFTEREYLSKLHLFFRALATRDYAKAADLALLLCGQLPVIDIEEVKDELVRGLRAWASRTFVKGLPYHEKSIDNATVVVTQILFRHGCPMDWGFLRVRRALTILDASLVHLDADINYTSLCASYFRKAERRRLTRELGPPLAIRAAGSVVNALDMQERLAEYSLFQGVLIRRHAQVFQGATDKLSELMAALLGYLGSALVAAAVVLALATIERRSPEAIAPIIGPQLGALLWRVPALGRGGFVVVFLILAYTWWIVRRLKRRFREKDVRLPGTQAGV